MALLGQHTDLKVAILSAQISALYKSFTYLLTF